MPQPDQPPAAIVQAKAPANTADSCAALILAAGASTRLGQPKQFLIYKGETLIHRAARLALAAGASPVFVIVPPENAPAPATVTVTPFPSDAYTQALAGLPLTVLANPEAATGLGSSLRLGITALTTRAPQTERVLLMVCDQPLLREHHLQALLTAHAGSPTGIAAASFQPLGQPPERPGVPAIFSRKHFPALAAATGDQGARTLLRTLPITTVPIPEAATDIDSPEDLRLLETNPPSTRQRRQHQRNPRRQ
jgi:molybdenum cofactor cytidylyltransferase